MSRGPKISVPQGESFPETAENNDDSTATPIRTTGWEVCQQGMRSSPKHWTLPSKQRKKSWRSLVAERWHISYKRPVDLFQLRRRIHVKDVLCRCFVALQMTFVWKRAAVFFGSCVLLKVRQGVAPAGLSPEGGDSRSSVSSLNKDGFSAHSFTFVPPQTTSGTCNNLRHWPWRSQRSLYLLTTMLISLKAVGDIKITLRPLPQTSAGADSIYGAPDLSWSRHCSLCPIPSSALCSL